jgi:aryl-alcohol dehydrogenase-like predicted oxidoreductase
MQTKPLGQHGPAVSLLGLGCMGMSDLYGPSDEAESAATIHAALDAGINLLDTGDFYGMGHNELLLGRALAGRPRDSYLLSVKFGALRDHNHGWLGVDGRPAAVKNFCAYSLRRLGTGHIDIYRLARVDPAVPVEETIGAISELIEQGVVRHAGLSETGTETIRRAAAVAPIADLQIEYSLFSRGIERGILPTCRELGIGITAYGVLSRGLLSGHWTRERSAQGRDFRNFLPRFSGDNLERNLALVEQLRGMAAQHGASVAQLAIAWARAQDGLIVPLIGARTRERLAEALGALELRLSPEELARIAALVPAEAVAGERYMAQQMAHLDSER